tara:strand:- start:2965 stop:4308 length:1344 start_codon:yes stop_codon:yes gene_type:complete
MSLTVLSKPEENNAVINTLPLILYSQNNNQSQFKYIIDAYKNGESQRLTRIKFANNAQFNNGVGTIDLSPLVRDYLGYDKPWYVSGSVNYTQNFNACRFDFIAGEEYAQTPSSSVDIYDGLGNTGQPAFTASQNNLFLVVNEYDEGSYNWDFNEYAGVPLTNYDYKNSFNTSAYPIDQRIEQGKIVYNGDYETVTYAARVSGSQSIIFTSIEVTIYSGSTQVAYQDITGVAAGTQDNENMLRYIGVGPENLSNFNATLQTAFDGEWTGYEVFTDCSIKNNTVDIFKSMYYKNGNCTNYDRTRFAFINKFGTWDYFNIDLPLGKMTKLKKKEVTRTHFQSQDFYTIPFSGSVPQLYGADVYNINSRGLDNYYTQPTDTFLITSNWLDQEDSDWLTQLIDSPDVYQQIDEYFQPINVLTARYNWRTNKRGQKNFQYEIEFELSNKRTSR